MEDTARVIEALLSGATIGEAFDSVEEEQVQEDI